MTPLLCAGKTVYNIISYLCIVLAGAIRKGATRLVPGLATGLRSGTQVTKEVIDAGDSLKIIGRAGTGIDNIDVASATEK